MLCSECPHMNKLLLLFIFLFSFLKFSDCEDCLYKNTCECVFRNGSVIDLTTLGNRYTYRWGKLKATKPDNFTYYYNPCYGFSLGDGDCSENIAVCQVFDGEEKIYYDCGNADKVNFHVENNIVMLIYSSSLRTTNVTLECSEDAFEPELTVQGELEKTHYAMTLKSRCACPDLCQTSHLSTGSVLVILFMIFVVLYLFLGIVHSRLTRGAHGWELIPHYEFWSDFPLLVRDGCVFVVSGCKPETAYDRI